MAYYSKMSAHPTRDQKRRQAENRGGFEDEGSQYSSARKGNKSGAPQTGDKRRSYAADSRKPEQTGDKRKAYQGDSRRPEQSGDKRRSSSFDSRKPEQTFDKRKSYQGDSRRAEQSGGNNRKFTRGKGNAGGEFRFAPRSTSPYRTRGEGITPKPYGVQRREQQSERSPEYTPYRAEPQETIENENLLSGRNPIREALKSGRDIEKLLVAKGELSGSAKEILAMAKQQRVPIQEVDRARLDAITPHHQGMLAFASAYQYHSVDEMLALAKSRNEQPFLVMLDGVTDPHNLGAVIRTAECAGAHGVIVQERRAVGLTPAAVKASAGAIEHIMVSRVVNLTSMLDTLQKQGIWAYAANAKGEDYTTVDFSGGVVLVIGAEGEGISRLVLEKCDKTVALPMRGQIGSLNASVAAGILLYAVLRSR